jgi:hypothetical protein
MLHRLLAHLDAHIPLPTLLSALGGLVGVAYAQTAPGSFPVPTPAGEVSIGDLSLPAALVIFGSILGRAVSALKDWRPHVIVEHRHRNSPGRTPTDDPAPSEDPS